MCSSENRKYRTLLIWNGNFLSLVEVYITFREGKPYCLFRFKVKLISLTSGI